MKKEIAIFASGSGSNTENIINYFQANMHLRVSLVVSNKSNAFVLQRAKNLGVQTYVLTKNDLTSPRSFLTFLHSKKIEFIVLAGYLKRIPVELITAYSHRIINIHPALLPKYGGKGMYGNFVHQAVLQAGEKETGITIHYVNECYDDGAILFQAKCPIFSDDTPETIAERVHLLEYQHYPLIIEKLVLLG